MNGFKLVRRVNDILYSSHLSRGESTIYLDNEFIFRKNDWGPFAVFNNLHDAVVFSSETYNWWIARSCKRTIKKLLYDHEAKYLELWNCEYDKSIDTCLWIRRQDYHDLWDIETEMVSGFPYGTDFADAVKLTRIIPTSLWRN